MANIANLSVGLGLDYAEFKNGLTKAERAAKSFTASIAKGTLAGNLLSDLAKEAAALPGKFVDLVKGAIDAADHLNDLSKTTGIAVETLGGIGFAAKQAGGDLDSAAAGVTKLNKSIIAAASGNKEAQEGFRALGISVRDSSGQIKSADKVLAEVAAAFAAAEDGPEKAAIAIRLFGKAGADMIPLLNDGAQALQDNIRFFKEYSGVTAETAAAADQFNDTLTKVALINESFGQQLAAELLPTLQKVADAYLDLKKNSTLLGNTATFLSGAFDVIVIAASKVGLIFTTVGRGIAAVAAAFVAFQNAEFGRVGEIFREFIAESNDADAANKRFIAGIGKTAEAVRGADFLRGEKGGYKAGDFKDPKKKRLPVIGSGAAGQVSEYDRLVKSLTGSIAELADELGRVQDEQQPLNDAQREAAKLAAQFAAGQTKLTKGEYEAAQALLAKKSALLDSIDAEKREQAAIATGLQQNAEFIEGLMQARDAAQERAKDMAFEASLYGKTAEEQEALTLARVRDIDVARLAAKAAQAEKAGLDELAQIYRDTAAAITATADARQGVLNQRLSEQNDPLAGATKGVTDYLNEIKRAGDATAQVVVGAARSLEDALVSAVTGGDIKSAFKSLITSLIAEAYRLAVIRPLLKSIFGGEGGGDGLLGLLKSLGGGGGATTQSGPTGGVDFSGVGFPLATGTNLIKEDGMLARLHKGEAVVPAKYNPAVHGISIRVENMPPEVAVAGARINEDGEAVLAMRRVAREELKQASRPGGAIRQGLRRTAPDRA